MLVRALRLVPEWLSRRTGAEVLSSSSHPTKRAPMRLWSSQSGGQQQSLSLERVAELIAAPEARVIVMAGAGVSVSAGIPDFRTPGSGLYDNLQEYGLPFPEAIFDLDFYQQNPRPFQRLCKELWPGNFRPTPTHYFLKLLDDHGKLLRCFTQNIDSLETSAGLPKDKVVAAHGNFDGAHVVGTHRPVPVEEVKLAAFGDESEWAALAQRHGGLVKPNIGESERELKLPLPPNSTSLQPC